MNLARLAALAAPAAVVAAALAVAGFFSDPESAVPVANRQTDAIVQALATDPDVIILGNSQAASGVDPAALAEALGLPADEVARVTLPGAHAPTVWALLQHRVYQAGHRPRLVVFAMSADHLLDDALPDGENRERLTAHVTGPDPVLDAKVYGRRWPRWEATLTAARTSRDGWLQAVTTAPLRLLDEPDPPARLDAARKAVLGEVAGAQLALNARMIPVVEDHGASSPASRDLDDALLVDLLDLVATHGGRAVVVTMPQRMRGLTTPRELTARLVDLTAAHGGAWVDLDHVSIPADGWLDRAHLAPAGAAVFTRAVAEALTDLGALGDAPLQQLPPPLPPARVTRTGDPPAPHATRLVPGDDPCRVRVVHDLPKALTDASLASRGLGYASPLTVAVGTRPLTPHRSVRPGQPCEGAFAIQADSLLISPFAPGLALADLSLGWSPAPHPVRAAASQTVEAEGWWIPAGGALGWSWEVPVPLPPDRRLHLLVVALDPDADVRLDGTALNRWGTLRYGTFPLPEALTGFTLTSTGHAMVRAVVVERGGRPTWVAGRPDAPLHRLVLEPGEHLGAPADAPPPRLVAAAATPEGRAVTWRVPGPDGALVHADVVAAAGDPRFKRCVPFEARPVGGAPALREDVRIDVVGTASVPVPAGATGAWELWTRPDPLCSRHLWLEPGASVELAVETGALHVPVDHLTLPVTSFGGTARLQLLHDGVPLAAWDSTAAPPPLSTPVAPQQPLTLSIRAPADGWVLLGPGQLDGPSPADAWFAADPAAPPPAPAATPAPTPPPASPGAPPDAAAPATPDLLEGRVDLTRHAARVTALPPGNARAEPAPGEGGPGLRLVAEDKGQLCLPDLRADRPVHAVARVRLDGGAGTAVLDARWLAGRKPVKSANGAPDLDVARADVPAEGWVDLTLDTAPRPGADAVRVCLRRQGTGDLVVGAWSAEAP